MALLWPLAVACAATDDAAKAQQAGSAGMSSVAVAGTLTVGGAGAPSTGGASEASVGGGGMAGLAGMDIGGSATTAGGPVGGFASDGGTSVGGVAGTGGVGGGAVSPVELDPALMARCTGKNPIKCTIPVPANGNYNVTVELGSAQAESTSQVEAELYRIVVPALKLAAGAYSQQTFSVNVRAEDHDDYDAPGQQLNILIDGDAPALRGLGYAAANIPTQGIAFVDLTTLALNYYASVDATKLFASTTEIAHFNVAGATALSKLVASALNAGTSPATSIAEFLK